MKRFLKRLLFIPLVLLINLSTAAGHIELHHVAETHGIQMREVYSVCSDADGFVWASTKTGIYRLAQNSYSFYQLPFESTNSYWVKLVFTKGLLIAFANNGQVFRYNVLMNRFDRVMNMATQLKEPFPGINDLVIDDSKHLWISATTGIFKFDGELVKINGPQKRFFNLVFRNKTELLAATDEEIISLNTRSLQSASVIKFPSRTQPTAIHYEAGTGRFWLGALSGGVMLYDLKKRVQIPIKASLPNQPVRAIVNDSDSTILIGIDGAGIWRMDSRFYKVVEVLKENPDDPGSLQGNGVYDLHIDEQKRIWVGTYTGGLSFFGNSIPEISHLKHHIGNDQSLSNNNVNKVIEDKEGKLWFATNNGLSAWNPQTSSWKHYFRNPEGRSTVFLAVCEDGKGRIWAGTYASGVFVLDMHSGKDLSDGFRKKHRNFPVTDYVFDILKDSSGDIWIGGLGDMYCFQEKADSFRKYGYQAMHAFAEKDASTLLIATSNGLVIMDKKSGHIQRKLDGYNLQDIIVKGDQIWTLPMGEGLISHDLKNGTTRKFTTKNGLSADFLNSAALAGDYLWLGSENGVCKLNIRTEKFAGFPGMPSLSGFAYNRNAATLLKDGRLAFGSNRGAVLFDPDKIAMGTQRAKIFINDIKVSGKSLRDFPEGFLATPVQVIRELKLGYDQNNFTLDLIPLGDAVSGSKFSWMLEGVDKAWSMPSSNNLIAYSNLPPGKMNLKIKLFNSALSAVVAEHTIRFEIMPPFWNTWWFITAAILLVLAALCFAFKTYINKLKRKHAEDKIRFFVNTAHDLRNSLALVNGPIQVLEEEALSTKGREYLLMAREQVSRLSMVASQLLDFQKADIGKEPVSLVMHDVVELVAQRIYMFQSLAQAKHVTLVFEHRQPVLHTAIDANAMEKVVDNLLSNAIKYAKEASEVKVILYASPTSWHLEVADQGIGITKNAQRKIFKEFYRSSNAVNAKIVGSGIGLLLVKRYVNMHGGTVSFSSTEGEGSVFKVSIPLKSVGKLVPDTNSHDGVPFREEEKSAMPVQDTEAGPQDKKLFRVLVVEDNDALRRFMVSFLEKEFEVLHAENGGVAWEFIGKYLPDLVISDIMMEGMNGHELCKLIKSTYETAHIPVILLTALATREDELYGLGLGADDYLTKPFDTALLSQRIKTIIYNRKMIRSRALKMIDRVEGEQLLENEHNDQFVKKALAAVLENLSDPAFGKEAFAKAMLVSPSLLYKKIKTLTDQAPSEFIKAVRLNYALEMLQAGNSSVLEISEKCGYSSIAYFSTAFKKHFGIPPSEANQVGTSEAD